ncbi:hypothetical protein GCM10010358_18260 [Streptomyces minutiscleroticus]|uniref:HTH gntR-type domain-containing protein n=1 Tax=Streptomyces minutiscleroticus TaxID=68238 RepID=A0A918KI19_9ACTN|nr:hypothetical protein GCM10010358_18260 [Streptomyces minutiscleroticus]
MAEELKRRIATGTYAPGTRMPGVAVLAAELDVAPATVQKAYAGLRTEGLLRTVLRQGSFVADESAPAKE